MASLTLTTHPLAVALLTDGCEADMYPQLMSLEQHILQYRRVLGGLGHLRQNAQRKGIVDHCLANIQDIQAIRETVRLMEAELKSFYGKMNHALFEFPAPLAKTLDACEKPKLSGCN